jgi:hypothetical protein
LGHKLIALACEHAPNRILIEQAGPGLHLIQELRANPTPSDALCSLVRLNFSTIEDLL